jgi:hypothetical protein
MYLTNLAAICRRADLEVVELAGWEDRGHGPMTAVKTITWHHTAGPPGLAGPLCHLGLSRTGTVYVVAAGLAWHAGMSRSLDFSNSRALGIEAENSGYEDWPRVQVDAWVTLTAALCEAYAVDPQRRVLGHKETCFPPRRKIDPRGIDMPLMRVRVAGEIADRASRSHDRAPGRQTPATLRRPLSLRSPMMRGRDVAAAQRALHVADDGVWGHDSDRAVRLFQRRAGLRVDGVLGPRTCRALGLRWDG